jgi:putative Ca2+/H+ antiporter (TMEM165/GDT1 family)
MYALLTSTGVVAISEVGDKTQLLALLLASHFRKPLPTVLRIFVASVLNHTAAALSCSTRASEGRCNGNTPSGRRVTDYFLVTGTGMPGILTLTAPRWLRLVK